MREWQWWLPFPASYRLGELDVPDEPGMFGQLWVAPEEPGELPGLADPEGDALGDGDAVAACATA